MNRAEGRAHRSVDLRRGSPVECVLRGLNSAQRHVVTAIDGDRARSRRPIIERQCPHDRGFRLDRDGLLAWLGLRIVRRVQKLEHPRERQAVRRNSRTNEVAGGRREDTIGRRKCRRGGEDKANFGRRGAYG